MKPQKHRTKDSYVRLGRDMRAEMIQETSAYLNWALMHSEALPRIPRARVDRGGFAALMDPAQLRQAGARWWAWALNVTDLDWPPRPRE